MTNGHILGKMVDDRFENGNPDVPTFRQIRERLEMTQEQIASYLGISSRTVIRHEGGQRRMKLNFSQIKRLQELLQQAGMSIDDLPDDI